MSRERRCRRRRKVLFSCVTFCASEIMGDHCPIRQSRGPKRTTARPGSSSSSLLHDLFPPHFSPRPHPVCPLRPHIVRSAPFPLLLLHTHPCPFVRSVPLTAVHLPPHTSSSSHLRSPFVSPHHRLPSSAPPSHPLLLARNHRTLPHAVRPFCPPCRCPLPVPALHAHIITAFVRPPHAFTHSRKAKQGVEKILLHQ